MIRQLFAKAPKCVALLGSLPLVGLTQLSLATPAPTSASGTIAAGQSLTVSGSNFGSTGPNVVLMEDFERDTAGQKVKLAGAPVGAWTGYNSSNSFLASPVAHTGNVGFHSYDYSGQGANILQLALGAQYQEAFISFWVTVPSGKSFPGALGPNGAAPPPAPGQFSYDSSWKMAWLLQGAGANSNAAQFDLRTLDYSGFGQFSPAESNANYTMYIQPGNYWQNANSIGTAWWSWNGWNRVTTWFRGNSTVPSGGISGFTQTLNAEHGMASYSFGNPVTYPTSAMFQNGVPQYFTQINIPGWIRPNSGPNCDPTYDDVYVAVGPGAVARVELTDAPTYTASKHVTILRTTSWSAGKVVASIPSAGLDFTGTAYLYVTDMNGTTNAAGLRVGNVGSTSGGGTTSTTTPDPPSNVAVQ
jgi:hypothetical protein